MNKQLAKIYKPGMVKFALNIWPPFWGAGIRILRISDDFRTVEMRLKLRWWNKNANRTQYGGSIFSLTDLNADGDLGGGVLCLGQGSEH